MTTPLMGGVGPGSGLFKIFTLVAVDGIAADANRIAPQTGIGLWGDCGKRMRIEKPRKPT